MKRFPEERLKRLNEMVKVARRRQGFGDITAQTETAQLVVTEQMVADLVIIGIAVKLIVGSVRRTHERRIEQTAAHR